LVPSGGGQFRLDLDDNDMSDNYSMPQLIETDLNEILNEPVKLPVTRSVCVCYQISLCLLPGQSVFVTRSVCVRSSGVGARLLNTC
jgi:hypothetical protein